MNLFGKKHGHHGHGHEERGHFLEIEHLRTEYTSGGDTVYAVNDVSLHLDKGKTLALVGETGAGKTTICKSILRILPDHAARIRSGKIYLEGEDLMELTEEDMCDIRGAKISMIFQDPMTALNPTMKIGEQIAEVISLHSKVSREEARKKATEMLNMVGIVAERYDEYPHQFSGGMKQRVVIAMALACIPDLLLADEPTSALDVTIQAQILEMIDDLRKKYNTALILVTHDMGIVAQNADEVAVIYAGEIVEYGDKRAVFEHPSHPYTVGLFNAIPDINSDSKRLANIEGLPPDPTNLPAGCCFNPRCPYATEDCRMKKAPLEKIGDHHLSRCTRGAERYGSHHAEEQEVHNEQLC